MPYDPDRHHRRSIRLRGYDYSQAGAYLVTIRTQGRSRLFGDVVDGRVELNHAGQMLWSEWEAIPARFPRIELDEFVVMPNHVHGIVWIVGAPLVGALSPDAEDGETTTVAPTLGEVVGTFKSLTTNGYIRGVKEHQWPAFPGRLWQRNYYEHIVRTDESLARIRQYIIDNPAQWADDDENPARGQP
jgi:REP-associated tyrosine transposase